MAADVLVRLGNGLLDRRFGAAESEAVRVAIASGHGIGKSALVAWIILWAMSTLRDTRGVVSANTEGQLRTKTWPELAKWHGMSRNREWFTYTATALHSAEPGRDKTWRVDAITWSEQNTEAIAGLHNKGRRAFALLRRGLGHPRPGVGHHRGRADRRRHRARLGGVRQPDAHRRPLPRMLRRRPLRPSLEPAADRFALGRHDQQGADRRPG